MAQHWVATDFGGLDVLRLVDVDVPAPGPGEVTIAVTAAGVNPADAKHVARPGDRDQLPVPIGYEVAGRITAVGPDTDIASGGGEVGDEVLAFRVRGGYATELTVPASAVFARPPALAPEEAANLLLAGTTAAEMLHVTGVRAGDTVLLHGASGAVGVSLLQQAALIDVRVVGTAGEAGADVVRRFGGEPVRYGDGLADRVRALAPGGVVAALDAVGTDEAVDVSLELVADRQRIVTIAAQSRAGRDGIRAIGGAMPASKAFRDAARARLVELAADGRLVVPMARTFPLTEARVALELLAGGHPGGKLALLP
ncbi:NADP-dependent oxidoreductase [Modestobacter muralis]|uniref:NADP-dependent oxidoreductase n=1 Tax=Modestobacter muralis TaxID=1608614 RepID=A0A6P0HBQ2_9ACTN|nr:NADP-dependent oxidoreductase [Modestobacter muralis]NEK96284.1 NADP-dependent oxidoreductase [Modestobacter muralis]NEN53172.1 NADP-dependent oxidoreductase [Modestobacter muralis]